MDTRELGELGEKMACGYLEENGFKILGKNWEIKFGEIDIIAKMGDTLHFVEVKTIFANSGFSPEDHVDYRKQIKLRSLAQIWLEKNKYPQDIPYQIDIVGITVNEQTRLAKLQYFPNAVAG